MENRETFLNMRVGYRRFDKENDEVDEVIGIGRLCHSCREYLTGALSDQDIPKPGNGSRHYGTGENILDKFERKSRKVKAEN